MQINKFSETVQNTSNENLLDNLIPNEVVGVIFDQVINQSQSLRSISSILLTCKKWKSILEGNFCISLAQAFSQLKKKPPFKITFPQCIITDQKKQLTSAELNLIDRAFRKQLIRFESLLR